MSSAKLDSRIRVLLWRQGGPLLDGLDAVGECLSSLYGVKRDVFIKLLSEPPRKELGDFGFPLLRYARSPSLEEIAACVENRAGHVSVRLEGGFLNIRFPGEPLAGETARLYSEGWRVGVALSPEPRVVVVEHTSANPVHPLHMGHARNACLGDALARMLSARGHRVVRRFYINDMGRQVAVLALGFKIAQLSPGELRERLSAKIDHAAGWLYAVTHTAIDLAEARRRGDQEEAARLASTLSGLRERGDPALADKVIDYVMSLEDPEKAVLEIVRRYERGEEPEKTLVRRIAEAVLEGFKETLSRLGIEFDYWDWESDIVWSGLMSRVLEELLSSRYIVTHKDARALDVNAVLRDFLRAHPEAVEKLRVPQGFEVPPMVLTRSDGTTLYWTRDVAYSIYKFESTGADYVVNVVGAEQKLPQLQIRLALLAIGRAREALGMTHYDYEIVRLPGARMSGRRGEYVTLDSIIEEVRARAVAEVSSRNPGLTREEAESIAEKVAVGAIRFSMIQAGASKPIVFDVEKALSFEANSGPYLQYSHARACSILAKHGPVDYRSADPAAFRDESRRELLLLALRLPLVAAKAAEELRPEDLASFLLKLADAFNKWYERDVVLREADYGVREAKALLVETVRDALRAGLEALGIPPLERM